MKRAILHIDMDAFYASVEQRDNVTLLGKAVIVGGDSKRAVVSAASYEARKFGVKSAMPVHVVKRLCPHAVVLPVRMARYVEVSKQVMEIFSRFSPLVEPLSIDEAFVDITGTEGLFGKPIDVAWKIQRAVREELNLSCSVGLASNKYVAKVASDLRKPGGLVVVVAGEEKEFLDPLPLDRLWGVGPKTAESLYALGLSTIGDVARAKPEMLTSRFGELGTHIWALAHGKDERPVDVDSEQKSIGAEHTLESDIKGKAQVEKALLPLIDEVCATLRRRQLRTNGIRLKLKYADFHRVSREQKLNQPVNDAESLRAVLTQLIDRVDVDRAIRLVGIAATSLVDATAPRQTDLFSVAVTEKQESLDSAVDAIRGKFGGDAVVRGAIGFGHTRLKDPPKQ